MTAATTRRLEALERALPTAGPRPLPMVVPDATTDANLARLQQQGRKVFRESDPAFIDQFV